MAVLLLRSPSMLLGPASRDQLGLGAVQRGVHVALGSLHIAASSALQCCQMECVLTC